MPGPDPIRLVVAGRIDDKQFQQCRVIGRYLSSAHAHVSLETNSMVESDWEEYIRVKAKELGGKAYTHRVSPLVYFNDTEYLGGTEELLTYAARVFDYNARPNQVLYTRMARREYKAYLDSNSNPFVFLDISVAGGKPERVVVELFAAVCPRTCENFRALCTGEKGKALHYVGTPFHRVVPGGWVQGGDINGGHGDGGESIYGKTFADESFAIKHDRPGILAMANDGGPHSNGSQFYITMRAMPWMDTKRVAFGRVISGMRTIRLIEKQACENQRPVADCTIVGAGGFDGNVYKTDPGRAGAGGGRGPIDAESKESKSGSASADRWDVYADVFNDIDEEGAGEVAGRLLARRLKRGAKALVPYFSARGAAILIRAMRAEEVVTFERWCAKADEIFSAVHSKGGVEAYARLHGVPNDPFSTDTRTEAEQKRSLDLRRPKTKKKLLRKIFDEVDTSGDNLVSRGELLAALKKPDSLLVTTFPKHVAEIPRWMEELTSATLTWPQFQAIATRALAKPGGRAGDVKIKPVDPLGKDTRPIAEKAKHMDLRRPKTKKKLLRKIFQEIDTSGDMLVSRSELLTALSATDGPLQRHFPKHLADVPRWLEASTNGDKLTFEQFLRVAWEAVNAPARPAAAEAEAEAEA